ncbi:MAG TPA: hypothetical protein VFK30_00525, partial [Anaerolineae bacterium]|nr:hypothetical protein [Anaerolineae bacterium]
MNAPLSKQRIPFDYLVTAVLTASGTLQVVLNLATDSNFELHAILGTSSADKATDFSPNNFSCQITDQ